VARCLEIIAYYEPRLWFIENPATGLLKTREIMLPLSRYIHTCSYGKYGRNYKATKIWTNREGLVLQYCTSNLCDHKRHHGTIHFACAQRGSRPGFVRSANRSETY
jgi:hypothetical protein